MIRGGYRICGGDATSLAQGCGSWCGASAGCIRNGVRVVEVFVFVAIVVGLAAFGLSGKRRRELPEDRSTSDTDQKLPPIAWPKPPEPSVAPPAAKPPSVLRGPCWVIDGDTIVIRNQNIRLHGIDAPEMDHPYGKKAKWELHALTKGQEITATVTGDLSYDRLVAVCTLPDGRDLSAEMVKLGMALDWTKHSGGKYRHLEPDGVRRKLWRADARQKGRMPPPAQRPG